MSLSTNSLVVNCKSQLSVPQYLSAINFPDTDLVDLLPAPSVVDDAVVAFYAARLNALFAVWSSAQWADAVRAVFSPSDTVYVDVQSMFTQSSVSGVARDLAAALLASSDRLASTTQPRFQVASVPGGVYFTPLALNDGFNIVLRLSVRVGGRAPAALNLVLTHAAGASLRRLSAASSADPSTVGDEDPTDLAPFRALAAQLEAMNVADTGAAGTDDVVLLRQSDFDAGAVYITRPGVYRLAENVRFFPTALRPSVQRASASSIGPQLAAADLDAFVARHDPELAPAIRMGLGLGFFAAIVVAADDVVLDLNKFTIEQDAAYALLQRFFAVVELASAPFIPMQGPFDASATPNFRTCRRVKVLNGVIGLSSHHGIHGNLCQDVLIDGVTFRGYEVAPIAINGGKRVVIQNVVCEGHRTDVPVAATYSNARFIRPYVAALPESATLGALSRAQILHALDDVIDIAYYGVTTGAAAWWRASEVARLDGAETVVATLPTGLAVTRAAARAAFELFHLPEGLIDGNAYGILSNSRGVAVGGFPDTLPSDAAMQFYIRDSSLRNVAGFVHEVPALRTTANKPAIDAVGAVVQTRITYRLTGARLCCDWEDGVAGVDPKLLTRYNGNALSNAQLLVTKYKADGALRAAGLDARRATADAAFLQWVEAWLSGVDAPAPFQSNYYMNADVMFHVQKGVIALKLDATLGVGVENVVIDNVRNVGGIGGDLEGDYTHPSAVNAAGANVVLEGYQGADARGATFTSSLDVHVRNLKIDNIVSASGDAIGVDVMKRSRGIYLHHVDVGALSAAAERKVEDYDALWAPRTNNPTTIPRAIAIHVDDTVRDVRLTESFLSGAILALGARETVSIDGRNVANAPLATVHIV